MRLRLARSRPNGIIAVLANFSAKMGGWPICFCMGSVCDVGVSCRTGGLCFSHRNRGIPRTTLCLCYAPGKPVDSTIIDALAKHLGDGWLFAVAAVIFAVVNSGLIPKWLSDRHDARTSDSADRRALIDHYEEEATNQRRWRTEDAERYEREINRLQSLIDKMSEAALLSERGNARLRHALNNIMHVLVGQYDIAMHRGEPAPFPVESFRNLFGISPDLDEKIRGLLGINAPPAKPPGSPTQSC